MRKAKPCNKEKLSQQDGPWATASGCFKFQHAPKMTTGLRSVARMMIWTLSVLLFIWMLISAYMWLKKDDTLSFLGMGHEDAKLACFFSAGALGLVGITHIISTIRCPNPRN